MKYYGYSRVSTKDQNLGRQEQFIEEWAKKKNVPITFFSDKLTGTNFDRPNYQEMKQLIKKGDTLVISELDRFGRDTKLIKDELYYYDQLGVNLVIGNMPHISIEPTDDETTKASKRLIKNMITEVFFYLTEIEVIKTKERTKQGLEAAKKRGVVLGRRNDKKRDEQIIQCVKAGMYNPADIAAEIKAGRNTVYYAMKRLNKQGLIPNVL